MGVYDNAACVAVHWPGFIFNVMAKNGVLDIVSGYSVVCVCVCVCLLTELHVASVHLAKQSIYRNTEQC